MKKTDYFDGRPKRRLHRVLSAAAAALLLTAVMLSLPGAGAASKSSVSGLRNSISATEEKIKALEGQIASTSSSITNEMDKKALIDQQLTLLGGKIELSNELLNEYAAQIAEKEAQISENEGTLEGRYQDFLLWLRMDYEYDTADALTLVLDAGSIDDFLSNAERMGSLMTYQTELMSELSGKIADLEDQKAVLEEYKRAQEKTLADLKADNEKYTQLLNQSASYISSLRSNKAAQEKALADSQAEFERLNKELEKELAELAAQNSAFVGGAYMWPLDLSWTYISSPYGWRDYPSHEFHTGLDIPANGGSNIYAANAGTIVRASEYSSYGNCVIIDHGGGQTTLYAHMSRILVSQGQTVSKGDVIGLVGSTGYSTGNHLHFEVRIDGKAQDPLGYVKSK